MPTLFTFFSPVLVVNIIISPLLSLLSSLLKINNAYNYLHNILRYESDLVNESTKYFLAKFLAAPTIILFAFNH